jgi:glycosyltransferase involved in cell wall biosynthesis
MGSSLWHELRERLAAAPFVVLPVRENNYSGGTISLLQAMAAGKAVIVSRTAAVREGYGLADGENCLLVPPGDGAALAEAMERLRNDRDLAARLDPRPRRTCGAFYRRAPGRRAGPVAAEAGDVLVSPTLKTGPDY